VAGYILLVVLEIGKYSHCILPSSSPSLHALVEVLVLSVYKALKTYRESRGRLVALLLQHNIGYFAACLGLFHRQLTDMISWPSSALNGINMISAVGVATHVSASDVNY
jgi:hypothetical protein